MANRKPGAVYALKNSLNGRLYIGYSLGPESRIREHHCSLRKGRHINRALQEDYDACGDDSFAWVTAGASHIVEELRALEARAIKVMSNRVQLYNQAVHFRGNVIDSHFVNLAGCLFLIEQGRYIPAFSNGK